MGYRRTLKDDIEEMLAEHDLLEILIALAQAVDERYVEAANRANIDYMRNPRSGEVSARWAMRSMIMRRAILDHERSMK